MFPKIPCVDDELYNSELCWKNNRTKFKKKKKKIQKVDPASDSVQLTSMSDFKKENGIKSKINGLKTKTKTKNDGMKKTG